MTPRITSTHLPPELPGYVRKSLRSDRKLLLPLVTRPLDLALYLTLDLALYLALDLALYLALNPAPYLALYPALYLVTVLATVLATVLRIWPCI